MRMKFLPCSLVATAAITMLAACSDSEDIGSSIIQDEVEVVVKDGFTLSGHTVGNTRIQSRTITQLLGSIDAKGYGNFKSDFVTQFMPAGEIDTVGITADDIDSLQMMLAIPNGGYIGDSIAPMGLRIYRLNKQLPSPIYSDFDPSDYYDESKPIASKIYTCSALGMADSLLEYNYRFVYCQLPVELGRELFEAYRENPSIYQEPSTFAQLFPGLYVANSYGAGRVIKIAGNTMRLFYHRTVTNETTGRDSTYNYVGNYYAVTPEVVTNNNIDFEMSSDLTDMAASGKSILVAPAGLDVEVTFPIEELLASYRADADGLAVVNTLTLEIPVAEIENSYGITPPPNLLMVLSSRKSEFFESNQVTDNKYSFYAAYDSVNKRYRFSGLREYFLTMLDKNEPLTADDFTFTLTPVTIDTENYSSSTSFYISAIVPYIDTPAMAELLLDEAKITFTYSKQSVNF